MQNAALVAERSSNLLMAQRKAAARAFFDAELGDLAQNVIFNVVELDDGGHRVAETRKHVIETQKGLIAPEFTSLRDVRLQRRH